MSNLLKNGAFCVLPFISKYQNLNGKNYLCCLSDIPIASVDSADAVTLREKIWNGEKIPHCTKCYDLEKNNTISERQRVSTRFLKDADIQKYIATWTPEAPLETFFYDIRFDNKCNLACISCNPTSSSLWAKELQKTVIKYPLNFDIDQCLSAKKIYLAGGEPLIIDEFINLIEKIANLKTQPELVINTNLTSIGDRLRESLLQIKNLNLTVSVDAFEKVNEYHRWPMKWKKFMDNLHFVRSNINCSIQFNTVIDAVTVINAWQLVEIEHLTDYWNLSILTHPSALKISNLHKSIKPDIARNFENFKKSKFYTHDLVFKSRVDNVLGELLMPGDHSMLSSFITEVDQRRKINHQDYLKIDLT
jgi:organic radical activating enzyme